MQGYQQPEPVHKRHISVGRSFSGGHPATALEILPQVPYFRLHYVHPFIKGPEQGRANFSWLFGLFSSSRSCISLGFGSFVQVNITLF